MLCIYLLSLNLWYVFRILQYSLSSNINESVVAPETIVLSYFECTLELRIIQSRKQFLLFLCSLRTPPHPPTPSSRTCWSQIPLMSQSLRERGFERQLLQCESSFLLITVSEIRIDECGSSVQTHSHHINCFFSFLCNIDIQISFLSFSACPCFPK